MWFGPANRAYSPVISGSLSAVSNFQLVAQGGSTNNAGSVTTAKPQMMLVWAAPAGGLPSGGHYQIIRRTNYGADVDYATTTNNYYVDTAATGFFSALNVSQGSAGAFGFTTVYDYDVVVVLADGTRSAKPVQFTCFHYRGGITGTATGGSSSTLVDSGQNWPTNQWLGYYVFYGASGNFPTSGSTPVAVCIGNTATTLSLVDLDGNPLSTVPAAGNTYQIGGDYFTGVGDVSFGQAGTPSFTDTGGSPVSPHTFTARITHDNTNGLLGFQRPSADPAGFIYGLEIGAFNYATWQQRIPASGQFTEFAIHHRCPTGDLPGAPWNNINASSMVSNGYGPSQVANTWQGFAVPLAALPFTTPAGGQTTFAGSVSSGGVLTVTSISGPGLDSGAWLTATGMPSGVYISANAGNQTGVGTYNVLRNAGAAVGAVGAFTDGKALSTNFYKGQYKIVGGSFANAIFYYDDIASTRVNTQAPGS